MIQTTAVFYNILYINGNVLYPKVHLKMTIGFPKVYLYKHILLNSKVCIPVPLNLIGAVYQGWALRSFPFTLRSFPF